MGFAALAPVDRFLARHRIPVLAGTAAAVIAASPLLLFLRFDFNPLHLQERQGAGGRDLSRIAQKPADRRQRGRDHDARPRCRQYVGAAAGVVAASGAGIDPRQPGARRPAAKTPTDRESRRGDNPLAQPSKGRTAAERPAEYPGSVLNRRGSRSDRRQFSRAGGRRGKAAVRTARLDWRQPTPPCASGPRRRWSSRCAPLSTSCGKP